MLFRVSDSRSGRLANAGLFAGPLAAVLAFLLMPAGYSDAQGAFVALDPAARLTAALAILMAVWWMTEALPIYATALLPLALFPLLGIADMEGVAGAYGNKIIFLFLGGFIVALALEKWGLHKRLALTVLGAVGANPVAIVGAFMAVSAVLSMWIMNTAATIMLLPVAVSVVRLLPGSDLADGKADDPFPVCLLLGIAYASSIGGMGTIIGTAPNVFLVSYVREHLGVEISFVQWMKFAVPLVVCFVPVAWLVLTRVVYRIDRQEIVGAVDLLQSERARLAPLSVGERRTLIIFLLTAALWLCRPLLNKLEMAGVQPFAGLSDSGIAIIAAVALFIVPANLRKREFLMDWDTAVRLPWGLLLLFGGGLALAGAIVTTGLSVYLGSLAAGLGAWPVWAIVLAVTLLIVFLTELTSNTATTATMVPVLMAVATGLQLDPLMLIVPAALAASSAFMLPVATPPNAIVFGSGLLRIGQMCRAGFVLNLIAIVLISLFGYAIIGRALGIVV